MNRLNILEILNNYFLDPTDEMKKKVVDMMNSLINENTYKEYLDLFFAAISSTQLYGFLSYLDVEERDYFFRSDFFKTSSYASKNIQFLNSGQLSLLNELELHKKVFISAPTSFGKTSIINEFVLMKLPELHSVIYIVPTNSLLEELFIKFTRFVKDLKDIKISTQPIKPESENSVLFLTPERFLIYYEEYGLKDTGLLVMDETYKIMDFSNVQISDFVNSRSVRFRKVADIVGTADCKSIFLSPFTYKLTDSMQRFLERFNIKKIDRKIEYVSREILCVDLADQFKSLFPMATQRYRTDDKISLKVSNLVLNLKDEKNIIYVRGYSDAYSIVEEISELAKPTDKSDRFCKFLNHLRKNFSIDDKSTWKIISGLEKGIGIYIAPVPRYIKREIIRLFEENQLHTLIVTTSFTEGVNTNAKNLIFTTLQNGRVKLTPIDTLNVAGRAGRFGKNSIGKIYCIKREIYNEVVKLHEEEIIKLENYNYYLQNNKPLDEHLDFEIDMMDDDYLNDTEKEKKQELEQLLAHYGLTKKDLQICLNVSNKWKLYLYDWFLKCGSNNEVYFNSIIDILNDTEKEKAITTIFEAIRNCFKSIKDNEVNVFPGEIYDIKAFDRVGNFTWGRLYSIFSSGTMIEIIRRNRNYVRGRYNDVMSNKFTKSPSEIKEIFNDCDASWVLSKYYLGDCVTEDTDAFFTEAFKFVSSIIQYKIPYYVGFFVSIFKLYLEKNKTKFDSSAIDVKKIVLSFEENAVNDEQTRLLIDFGLSNDSISKIKDNNISLKDVLNGTYDQNIFDDFEILMINDFAEVMK